MAPPVEQLAEVSHLFMGADLYASILLLLDSSKLCHVREYCSNSATSSMTEVV